jgi:hypothetical protein
MSPSRHADALEAKMAQELNYTDCCIIANSQLEPIRGLAAVNVVKCAPDRQLGRRLWDDRHSAPTCCPK